MKKNEKFSNLLEKFDEIRKLFEELKSGKELSDEQIRDLDNSVILTFMKLYNESMNFILRCIN